MNASANMSRKKLAVVLCLLLALNVAVGWLFQANATPASEPVFLPDFESTLQLVQVSSSDNRPGEQPLPEPDVQNLASANADVDAIAVADSPLEAATVATVTSAMATPASLPQRCAVWGPFDSAAKAEQQAGALGEVLEQVQYSSALIEKKPHYLVYIGPYKSAALARQAHDKLKAEGLDAFVLQRGRLKNAVSVGLYAGPKSAEKQRLRVQALGYNVQQTKRKRMRRVHHMSAWVADNGERLPGESPDSAAASCSTGSDNIAAVWSPG